MCGSEALGLFFHGIDCHRLLWVAQTRDAGVFGSSMVCLEVVLLSFKSVYIFLSWSLPSG